MEIFRDPYLTEKVCLAPRNNSPQFQGASTPVFLNDLSKGVVEMSSAAAETDISAIAASPVQLGSSSTYRLRDLSTDVYNFWQSIRKLWPNLNLCTERGH